MAQANLATKFGLTVTGTTGATWSAAGRDTKGVFQWRDLAITSPSAQTQFSQTAGLQSDGVTWKSNSIAKYPVMKSIATDGDAEGYIAKPTVADDNIFELRCKRSGLTGNADALAMLEAYLSGIYNNASVKNAIIGYTQPDA
jgi:hypothetical protein